MKKWIITLVALLMLFTVSHADRATEEEIIQLAQGLLTEVYGYTQEEADSFTYNISDEDKLWLVRFYQSTSWVYEAKIIKSDLSISSYKAPIGTSSKAKASENSVRALLHEMEENDWFSKWNADSKQALRETLAQYSDIRINNSMDRGLQTDGYTPAQALEDFFLSCYGERAYWSPKTLLAWRDATFEAFGLDGNVPFVAMRQGIQTYTIGDMERDGMTICEFSGMVPEALTQVFSHPKLEGWVCLAGAYQARSKSVAADMSPGKGLAAFGKGEERLLVMLVQDNVTLDWNVFPVSETALYKNRDFFIRYSGSTGKFEIVYPISDTETEYFGCRVVIMSRLLEHSYVCELDQYCHINNGDNTMFIVDARPNIGILSWYHTISVQNGSKKEARYPALNSGLMEYINVSDFPTTEEACREAAAASQEIPDGYGITVGVHLRKDTSSHSKDLGMYMPGTLVEILDTLPGTRAPWYHVRIGVAEGYMSSNYVAYKEEQLETRFHPVVSVGRLKNDTQLKQGTGLFDAAVVKLPAGSLVRVLADRGNWLHVSVPSEENSWFMQPGETNGYIKKFAVEQAAVPLQLDWLMPGDE